MGCFTHLYKSNFWLKNESFNNFFSEWFPKCKMLGWTDIVGVPSEISMEILSGNTQ